MKYRFKTKPYAHQRKALRRLLAQGYGGALLMEPRTGKSKTTIDWLSILAQKKEIDSALIICPNRVMGTWVREFLIHSPANVHITVWDKDARKTVPARPIGYDLYVIVVNFEAFATPGRKLPSGKRSKTSGRFKVRTLLRKWLEGHTAACVVDESHKIKNPSGKWSTMIVSLREDFPYRAILTGTPTTKASRTYDIYMQWKFLNPQRFSDLPTVADFKEQYGRWMQMDGYTRYLGPRNLEELNKRMSRDAVIVRRDQCFDLPPREDRVVNVELGPETRRVYNDMAEEMIARIKEDRYAEATIRLVQNLRLSQITSGFVTADDGSIQRLGREKADELAEILEEEFDREQKVVVAARWRPDLDLIEQLGKQLKAPVWSVRGGVTRAQSDENIHLFREHTGAGLMVIQPSASSLGIDLSTAAHMIWYSHTPSWVDYTQSCDRIALSRTSTTFTHLIAKRSVDEVLLATLATDGEVARSIMTTPEELLSGHELTLDKSGRLEIG